MRIFLLTAAAAMMTMIGFGCASDHHPSAQEIVTQFQNRSTGKRPEVKSALLTFQENQDNRLLTVRYQAPDKFRIDAIGDISGESVIINGNKGWVYQTGGGLREMSPDELKMAKASFAAMPFRAKLQENTDSIEFVGDGGAGGEDCWVLSVDPSFTPEGVRLLGYFSKENFLLRKTWNDTVTPERETVFFDYADHDGIMLPGVIIETSGNNVIRRNLVNAQWNTTFPESVFEPFAKLK